MDRAVDSLRVQTNTLLNDVSLHNSNNEGSVTAWLNEKKAKALSITGAIESLGIPIRKRGVSDTFTVPIQRKQIVLSPPRPAADNYRPEPSISVETYHEILKVLRSMSLAIERAPHSFQGKDEETIRDMFLVPLNGQFQGDTIGETFNTTGKTDILIRNGDRNIFIGECKFWSGPAGFEETIDQLLKYLGWRDCKCALIIFNKSKNSSAVLGKMHDAMTKRKEYKKTVNAPNDGEANYIFVKESDPGKEIHIAAMLFDLPEDEKKEFISEAKSSKKASKKSGGV